MATFLLSTPTTHSVSDVAQELAEVLGCISATHNCLLPGTFNLPVQSYITTRLNGYILICQMVTSPLVVRHVFHSQWENKQYIGTAGDVVLAYFSIWNLDFFQNTLLSILSASKSHHTANAVSGLHHSSLPSCPHHPHLHTSQTPLPQLHTCGVALHQMLCSLSKAVGHSELTRGCVCNLPPPLLCQIFKCLIRYSSTNISVEHDT